ncbi:MAG: hypothetical protein TR69_WS6001000500 [candidate division WS6 bacterium OLB20]|uniref:Uncharacterized protein n=1 Tax=candidate division WS6 bacterium OLB20 TaxID=1617426 RepID=A0A136LXZ4_9BACT|nr:MAG: hypothetical protein TR69_WS6001000500 [candidate division WS6 bacterium OLB20]
MTYSCTNIKLACAVKTGNNDIITQLKTWIMAGLAHTPESYRPRPPVPPGREAGAGNPPNQNEQLDGTHYGRRFQDEALRRTGSTQGNGESEDPEKAAKAKEKELKRKKRELERQMTIQSHRFALSGRRGDKQAEAEFEQRQQKLRQAAENTDIKAETIAQLRGELSQTDEQDKRSAVKDKLAERTAEAEARLSEETVSSDEDPRAFEAEISELVNEGVVPQDAQSQEVQAARNAIRKSEQVRAELAEVLKNQTAEAKTPETSAEDADMIERLTRSVRKRLVAINLMITGVFRSAEDKYKMLKNAGFSDAEIASRYPDVIREKVSAERDRARTQLEEDERAARQKQTEEEERAEEVRQRQTALEEERERAAVREEIARSSDTSNTTKGTEAADGPHKLREKRILAIEQMRGTTLQEKALSGGVEGLSMTEVQQLRATELAQLREALKDPVMMPRSGWKARIEQANEEILMDSLAMAPLFDPSNMFETGSGVMPLNNIEDYLSDTGNGQLTGTPSERVRQHIANVYKRYFDDPEQQTALERAFLQGDTSGLERTVESTSARSPVLERAYLEMESMYETIMERNRQNRLLMAVLTQGMLGSEVHPDNPPAEDDASLKNSVAEAQSRLEGRDPAETATLFEQANTTLRMYVVEDLFSRVQPPGNIEAVRALLASPDAVLTITPSGVAIRMNASDIGTLVEAYTNGTTRAADVDARGVTIDGVIFSSHETDNHELGHQIRGVLRQQELPPNRHTSPA